MGSIVLRIFALSLAGALMVPAALASPIAVGTIDYDVTSSTTAEFDILNQTGPNSSTYPDMTFPVVNSISLSSLSLTVEFASGPNEVFGSSYFTLGPDGLSFNGASESTTSGQPSGFKGATSFVLTGDFSTTAFNLNNGTTVNVNPAFTTTFTDPTGLADGDFGVIYATPSTTGTPSPVPEPESLALVGTGLAGLAVVRRRFALAAGRKLLRWSAVGSGAALAVLAAAAITASASVPTDSVKLNSYTAPSSGTAGTTFVNVTGSGFPAGSIAPGSVTVTMAATCGGTPVVTTKASSVISTIGTSDRIQFEIPATDSITKTANYFVSVTGISAAGTPFISSDCSEISISPSPVVLASCVPTSSIAVTVGTNVNAYVPFGYWEGSSTGVEEVALEGTDSPQHFGTPGTVNSCASNSSTKEVVCTENGANVDLINGSTLTTIVSDSNQYASFSGGSCENCGVAINAQTNTAIIGMGLSGADSGSGVQLINLSNNTLGTALPMANHVSENVSVDPFRKLILSPGEGGIYDLLQVGTGGTLTEFGYDIGGTLDSAAEDCTTGIALSADEFTDNIYITDLTQAKFTAGSPGSWTAPGQFFNLSDGGYSAGTSGISSAPGSTHLAVVTGEFGGSAYSALLLPSTSGKGTPTLADYAYVGSMPNTPDGSPFSAGYDPHTLTAYTSPNTGKSYAVFVDYAPGYPDYLGVVDLACVLGQPRTAGTHDVVGSASTCTRYLAIP